MSWGAVGWFVVKLAVAYAIAYYLRDEMKVEGPRMDSLTLQSSTYGRSIARVYGSARLAGNVIWSEGIKEHKEESGGGKGTGPDVTTVTYTYTCSFAVGICEGEIVGVKRIWADGKLIYDRSKGDDAVTNWKRYRLSKKAVAASASVTVYTGTETQEPDPIMEAVEGVGNVPAYRDLAYIVFEDMRLNGFGYRIPNLEFEIATHSGDYPAYLTSEDLGDNIQTNTSTSGSFYTSLYYKGDQLILDNTFDDEISVHSYKTGSLLRSRSTAGLGEGRAVHLYNGEPTLFTKSGNNCIARGLVTGRSRAYNNVFANAVAYPGEHSWFWLGCIGYSEYFGTTVYLLVETGDIGSYGPTFINVFPFPEVLSYVEEGGDIVKPMAVFPCNYKIGQMALYEDLLITSESASMYIKTTTFDSLPDYENNFPRTIVAGFSGGISVNDYGDILLIQTGLDDAYGEENGSGIVAIDSSTGAVIETTVYQDGSEYPAGVDDIAEDIFTRCGLSESEYCVSKLSGDTVIGYVQTDVMRGEDLIKPLMRLYRFDVVEADWVVSCIKRGSAAVTNISWDDLAAAEHGKTGIEEPLLETIKAETDMPLKLLLEYWDYDTDYQAAVEHATRSSEAVNAETSMTIRCPAIMQATQAIRAAETLFATTWMQRKSYQFQVPADYIKLLPSDVITVANSYTLLITRLSVSFPNRLNIEAVAEDEATYASNSQGAAPYVPTQTIPETAMPFGIFIDGPALTDYANTLGFHMAVYAMEQGWETTLVFRSLDDGATWTEIATVLNMSVVGRTTTQLGDGPVTVMDKGNTVNVDLATYDTSLSGASLLSILSGTNTAAIGDHGRWEIVSFQSVTQEADGTFTLSNLVRGRRGTDHNTGNHTADDAFVLLEEDKLIFIAVPEAYLSSTVLYKLVPVGGSFDDTFQTEFTCHGEILTPYSPAHVKGEWETDGDILISWVRRSRSDYGWNSGDVPLLEESEDYEIDIYDGDSVVRTIEVEDATSATYTAAQQTSDFGSQQSSLTLIVYQKSSVVGRGNGRPATIAQGA